jgi:hypothetical protein
LPLLDGTPSGTITPPLPPISKTLVIKSTKRSSVLVEEIVKSSLLSSLSILPLNGGLAKTT